MLATIVDTVRELDGDALTTRFRELELERRRVESEMAVVVAEADRRGIHTADGHRSVKGWLLANANWSGGHAARARRLARLVETIPEAGEALHAGRIGVEQADELARCRANPRCGDRLADSADLLLDHAEHLPYDESRACVRRWETLADLDGAHRDRERAVEHRSAIVTEIDGAVFIQASGGEALDTAEKLATFDHFVEREFQADVAERTRLHGPDAPPSLLPRTDAQRRFDAMTALFRAAIASPDAGKPAGLVLHVVSDRWTFESTLAAHGLIPALSDRLVGDVADVAEQRCETVDGIALLPDDILRAALDGHVRRVVMNSAGVVTDFGRSRRLFGGAARDAVRLMARHCGYPGCAVKASSGQVDHLDEWERDDGPTDLANAGIACGHHNRVKHRTGLRVRRDRQGRLFTLRPNGEPMLPAGRTPPGEIDLFTDAEHDRFVRDRLAAELRAPPRSPPA